MHWGGTSLRTREMDVSFPKEGRYKSSCPVATSAVSIFKSKPIESITSYEPQRKGVQRGLPFLFLHLSRPKGMPTCCSIFYSHHPAQEPGSAPCCCAESALYSTSDFPTPKLYGGSKHKETNSTILFRTSMNGGTGPPVSCSPFHLTFTHG